MSAKLITCASIRIVGSNDLHERILRAIESGALVFTGSELEFVESAPLSGPERDRLISDGADIVVVG